MILGPNLKANLKAEMTWNSTKFQLILYLQAEHVNRWTESRHTNG